MSLRGDSGDDGGCVGQVDGLSDDLWVGVELCFPECVAEDDGRLVGLDFY